jgi:hypothetical protein
MLVPVILMDLMFLKPGPDTAAVGLLDVVIV